MEVVNIILVHLMRGFNKKHPKTWDENLIYMQHSYNRAVHTSIGKFHFETCFGYLPTSPLDVSYGQQRGLKEDTTNEVLRDENSIYKIRKIHL